ncbi:MAG TPA: DUF4398 domain-containing protein [Burkholderiales bacterium]|nr:DUF4398 domain-containing protein [Burkholderiales bacterium]
MPYIVCKACTDRSDLQRSFTLPNLQRIFALTMALGLGACSGMPRPDEQIDAARAAVSKAQPVVVQDGSMELRVAQYKLDRAEQHAERGDYTNARIYAEQAQVDADYARAIAENARVERAAADANLGVRHLQDELDRRAK